MILQTSPTHFSQKPDCERSMGSIRRRLKILKKKWKKVLKLTILKKRVSEKEICIKVFFKKWWLVGV
jgi:hypothetical protein